MAALPVEVLMGVYLGVLTGIVPAVVAWALGFLFKYFTGITVPALAVVMLSVAIAGVNGGLLALNDPTVRGAPNSVTLTVALLVIMMMALYAHFQGDSLGASLPRRLSFKELRERTFSADVIERAGGLGHVRVTVTGAVEGLEGYPPLPFDLREAIRGGEWTFPADAPLPDLEARLADRLRTEFDLVEASVEIDERGRASVTAAPPAGGLSKRVPEGTRAVSVRALVPTGLACGDAVWVRTPETAVEGVAVSARSTVEPSSVETDGGEDATLEADPVAAPTADGGDGQVTVAVPSRDAGALLDADRAHVVVRSRGTRREFELLSLLQRAGKRFRKLTVRADGALDGRTLGDAAVRDAFGVAVVAAQGADGWTVVPRGDARIAAGDELLAVGGSGDLNRFEEAVA